MAEGALSHVMDSVRILVIADFMSAKINYKRKLKLATTTIYPVLGQIHDRDAREKIGK
jgi:hypothetical protein